MKKKLFFVLLCFFMIICESCQNSTLDSTLLNGYWEIDYVTMPNGEKKSYGYNPIIDFYEITSDTTGIRKKVQPNFNGSFSTSKDSKSFNIKKLDNELILQYNDDTSSSVWKETIITLEENKMTIKNKEGITYIYKRYKKLDL